MQAFLTSILDNGASYLGSALVGAVVAALTGLYKKIRKPAMEKMAIYLTHTGTDLEVHRAAVLKRLAKDPVEVLEGPQPWVPGSDAAGQPPDAEEERRRREAAELRAKERADAIGKAKMFVGLYSYQYGDTEPNDTISVADRELEIALGTHDETRLRLWVVQRSQQDWPLRDPDAGWKDDTSPIGGLRAKVFGGKNWRQLPSNPRRLAREVAGAVYQVRTRIVPGSRYYKTLFDPQVLLTSGVAAFAASVYFAIRVSVVEGPDSFLTVVSLSVLCGVAAYIARYLCGVVFLR